MLCGDSEGGAKRCGAKTRSGGTCRQPAMANGRCRMHGGNHPGGAAHYNYKHGRYSKHYPKQLRLAYERALADPELTGLRQQIADLWAKREELLKRMCVSPPPWEAALRAVRRLGEEARSESRTWDDLLVALGELQAVVEEGAAAVATYERAWLELREIIQETAKVSATESKRLHDEGLVLTAENSLAFVVGVREMLRKYLLDEALYAAGPRAVYDAVVRETAPLLGGDRPLPSNDLIEGDEDAGDAGAEATP